MPKKKPPAPRTIPFYGVSDVAIARIATDRIREFLQVAQGSSCKVPLAAGALLHLELALNLLEARNKTVQSVYWNAAPAEVRRSVYQQILSVEQMILHNLEAFGVQWDAYLDSIAGQQVVFPVPSSLQARPELLEVMDFQGSKRREIAQSIHALQKIQGSIIDRGGAEDGSQPG